MDNVHYNDNINKREPYTVGQTETIEMMIGFTEWMADNDVTLWSKNDLGGNKTHQLEYDDRFYTTIELLTKYLTEVLSKPPKQIKQ